MLKIFKYLNMEIFIYLLLIVLIIILLAYIIVVQYVETRPNLTRWFKNSYLITNLDTDNIILKQIIILKTNMSSFDFFTKTFCHYDIMIVDENDNYYIYYFNKDGENYNRYIQKIDTNKIQNNKYKLRHQTKFWTYKISSKKHNIKPISFRQFDIINEQLVKFGYHLSKFNCHHRNEMLINILTNHEIYSSKNNSIFKTSYEILHEIISKVFK